MPVEPAVSSKDALLVRLKKSLPWFAAAVATFCVAMLLMHTAGVLEQNAHFLLLCALPVVIGLVILLPREVPASDAPQSPPVAPQSAAPVAHGTPVPRDDFPYDAPWWIRYPLGMLFFAGAYYSAAEWSNRFAWVFALLLVVGGLGLVRELFIAVLVAGLVGGGLWLAGAAIAALPVSAAIIIGAMIIAQAVRR